jgi:hypothetical protein
LVKQGWPEVGVLVISDTARPVRPAVLVERIRALFLITAYQQVALILPRSVKAWWLRADPF